MYLSIERGVEVAASSSKYVRNGWKFKETSDSIGFWFLSEIPLIGQTDASKNRDKTGPINKSYRVRKDAKYICWGE